MFDLFGNMDSAEEINKTAAGLLDEGDTDNIKKLAEENGIQAEIADLFIAGEIDWIADDMTAAIGKIQIEEDDLKPEDIMKDWVEYLKTRCMESNVVAKAVRKKDKSLKGCITAILVWSFQNQKPIDGDILKAAEIKYKVTIGIPGMGKVKQIITEYYTK